MKGNHLSNHFSGCLRTFAYFMSSGSHYMIDDLDYIKLYGMDPSAIEMCYAIFCNVIEIDDNGRVINFVYAQKRATDYIRSYMNPKYSIEPPLQDWERNLYHFK